MEGFSLLGFPAKSLCSLCFDGFMLLNVFPFHGIVKFLSLDFNLISLAVAIFLQFLHLPCFVDVIYLRYGCCHTLETSFKDVWACFKEVSTSLGFINSFHKVIPPLEARHWLILYLGGFYTMFWGLDYVHSGEHWDSSPNKPPFCGTTPSLRGFYVHVVCFIVAWLGILPNMGDKSLLYIS